MDILLSLKKMLILSALFHAGLAVVILAIALQRSAHPFHLQAYQVDLVTFPSSSAPPAQVKETPAAPPPVRKPPVKVKEEKQPAKVKLKKPPVKPPKPISPVAVIPPKGKSKETPPSKEAVPEEQPSAAETAKHSEDLSAIPSPAAKIEAGVEAPDFKYPYYLNLIQQKIEMHWSPPPVENSSSEPKETIVAFVLSANGKIDDPRIERSSGNAYFDQAALRAIYQASPLPPFPQGLRDPSLKVHFSFSLMKKS
jgi:periplasmic protein TonB